LVDEPRTPPLRRIEQGVERRIRELQDAGGLSGLPGEGAPLPPDPDDTAGELWASRHIMRTSGSQPQWAELRRDIAARRSRIVTRLRAHLAWLERRASLLEHVPAERLVSEVNATRQADERVRAEVGAAIDELNALTRRHNLLVTAPSLHLATTAPESLMEIARERR
jgi:hypothetical protein